MKTKAVNSIKRNIDGKQNLADLRKVVALDKSIRVHKQSGNWILLRSGENCWHEQPLPYWYSERQALQYAIYGEVESE